MSWYVYENWQAEGHKARVHRSDCSYCNDGQGIHRGAGASNGRWHGSFGSYELARRAAVATGGVVSECRRCHPAGRRVSRNDTGGSHDQAPSRGGAAEEVLQFTLGGRDMALTREEVISRLRGRTPGTLRTHAVEVEGRLFPVKEAFAVATGTDLLDANTYQARSVLQRLGFNVRRVE